jgi:hypothetical protein
MTRKDYMSGTVTHQQYYGSVVKAAGIKFDSDDPIVQRAKGSVDPHYNDIPLGRWDAMALFARPSIAAALKQHDDGWSLAGGVCTMKEAVRQAVEGSK